MLSICWERARGGDPRAMDEVLQCLSPRLTRMASYYARCSREDADDLLQEARAGLLEALPVLDVRIGNPECYLLQYARWRVLDAIKRRRDTVVPLSEEAAAPFEHAATVFDFAASLNPVQRAILACLLAGCTWRETGALLGCTSANVAYHVRRIREQYARWGL
jgi:RNA polymerase sigma-70 factor (ECF subfamily)